MNKRGRIKTKIDGGKHRGFKRGYNAVPIGKQDELRRRLQLVIGGKTRAKMLYWKTGKTIIQPEDAKRIEQIFRSYGITEIWDE